jgi:hypothetical protein
MQRLLKDLDDVAAARSTQTLVMEQAVLQQCRPQNNAHWHQFAALLAAVRSTFRLSHQSVDSGQLDEDSRNSKLMAYRSFVRSFLHRLPYSEGVSSSPLSGAEHAENSVQHRHQRILFSSTAGGARIGDTHTPKRFISQLTDNVETRNQAELQKIVCGSTFCIVPVYLFTYPESRQPSINKKHTIFCIL